MSKAVLLSIRPGWVEKIASGDKTVEVRKTRPRIDTPFKCYIYCTKAKMPIRDNGSIVMYEDDLAILNGWRSGIGNPCGMLGVGEQLINSKVIGEFVCHNIFTIYYDSDIRYGIDYPNEYAKSIMEKSKLTLWEMKDYLNGKDGYAWVISDLKIYDEPKLLSDFCRWYEGGEDIRPCQNGKNCKYEYFDYGEDTTACGIDYDGTDCPYLKVQRPPQSWMYVEELE